MTAWIWQVFFWGGMAFCVAGLYAAFRAQRFLQSAQTATGTVLRIEEARIALTAIPNFAPVVRFKAASGKEFEFTDAINSRPARYQAGDTVEVSYDPGDPSNARIGRKRVYFRAAVTLCLGAAWAAFGFAGLHIATPRHEVVAAPQGAVVAPFVGAWSNENSNTGGITRILISPAGTGEVEVKAWGKCHPQDCDWGRPERIDLTRAGARVIEVTWHPRFALKTQSLQALPDGRLQVVTQTHFTDRSNRRDFTSTEFFKAE